MVIQINHGEDRSRTQSVFGKPYLRFIAEAKSESLLAEKIATAQEIIQRFG